MVGVTAFHAISRPLEMVQNSI